MLESPTIYDARWKGYQEKTHSLIIPYLKSGKRALDVGCGTGTLLKKIPSAYEKVGVDPSSEMVQAARAKVPKATIHKGTLESVDGRYDYILSSSSLHRIKDKKQFFEEAASMLNEQGKLLIVDWEAVFPHSILYKLYSWIDAEYIQAASLQDIVRLAEHAGFTIEHKETVFWWSWRVFFIVVSPKTL